MDANTLVVGNQITLFAGFMPDIGGHSHSTAVLVFSLNGEKIGIRECRGGDWQDYRSYFLSPGVRNEIRQYGHPIGCVFFEPESSLYPQFVAAKQVFEPGIHAYTGALEGLIDLILAFVNAPSEVDELVSSVVRFLLGEAKQCEKVIQDYRVLECSDRIKNNISENLSAVELAQQVGISERQLSSLFKKDMGIPIRKYRLWLRLKEVARLVNAGSALTDAALGAGFSDSAHFANTCRKLLGIKPTDLLVTARPLLLFASSDNL